MQLVMEYQQKRPWAQSAAMLLTWCNGRARSQEEMLAQQQQLQRGHIEVNEFIMIIT